MTGVVKLGPQAWEATTAASGASQRALEFGRGADLNLSREHFVAKAGNGVENHLRQLRPELVPASVVWADVQGAVCEPNVMMPGRPRAIPDLLHDPVHPL